MSGASEARASEAFHPEIEGLRGVAVLLVLLFHAGLVGIPGGFIGVDVFFVISGYLITGLLLRERERTGTIRFGAFYARRVRRLLPAGLVALGVTLGASVVVVNPLDRAGAAFDAAAAALSVGNIRFAIQEGDYFVAVQSPSPFLHYWSLAVEEQFYLLWPAVVLVGTAGRRPRRALGAVLAILIGGSFVVAQVITDQAPNWAFYSLPTRAWQLGVGGMLAVLAVGSAPAPGRLAAGFGWLGLGMLCVAAVAFDSSLAYPGYWAAAPTIGAAALIVSGTARWGPGRLMAVPPLRFLGRISYSLYLWHWPILVLAGVAAGAELPLEARLGLVLLSIVVAWASWRLIEEPFRRGLPSLALRPRRTVAFGGVAVMVVVTSAAGLASAAAPPAGDWIPAGETTSGTESLAPWIPVVDVTDPAGPAPAPSAPPTGWWWTVDLPGGATDDPGRATQSPGPGATSSPGAPSPTPRTYVRLPADVRPALAAARADEERLRSDGCLAFERDVRPRDCVYGVKDGRFTIALVGDSHAAQWFPALEQIALARGWRLVPMVKVSCPFLDIPVINLALKREYRECRAFNEAVINRLTALRPDLILVSMSRFAIHPARSLDANIGAQADSLARMVARLPGSVALIVDTPDGGQDIPGCLATHVSDVRGCAVPVPRAFALDLGRLEREAAGKAGVELIDMTNAVCVADPCPVVVNGMIVFRDMRHLTATYARSLAPALDSLMQPVVDRLVPEER